MTPSSATNKSLKWTSDKPGIASVDDEGNVTAVSTGEAKITAEARDGSSKSAECTVEVTASGDIPVSDIILNEYSIKLNKGATFNLVADVLPYYATNRQIRWKSTNEAVATVDAKGTVKAKAKGTAGIRAEATDGSGSYSECTVTVNEPEPQKVKVTGVSLNYKSLTINKNSSKTLTATLTPRNATNRAVTWTSSNKAVATVDSKGRIKAVKDGKTTITVKTDDGGKTARCEVKVVTPVKKVSFKAKTYYVALNKTVTVKSEVSPSDATNKAVTYKSSNTKIATVEKNGKVKGKKTGSVSITVTTADGKKTATCTVKVADMTFKKTKINAVYNKQYKLSPVLKNDIIKTVKTSNSKIAAVTRTDKYITVKTKKKTGTATITVTSRAGVTRKIKVTVKKR